MLFEEFTQFVDWRLLSKDASLGVHRMVACTFPYLRVQESVLRATKVGHRVVQNFVVGRGARRQRT